MSDENKPFPNEMVIRRAMNGVLDPSHQDIDTLYARVSEGLSGRALTGRQYVALWMFAAKGIWHTDHFMVWYIIECGWLTAWTEAILLATSDWTDDQFKAFWTQAKAEVLSIKNSWRNDSL